MKITIKLFLSVMLSCMFGVLLLTSSAEEEEVVTNGKTTKIDIPDSKSGTEDELDYKNAQPMPMPSVKMPPQKATDTGETVKGAEKSGVVRGSDGNGKQTPVIVVPMERVKD
jgi:hypothetical protein